MTELSYLSLRIIWIVNVSFESPAVFRDIETRLVGIWQHQSSELFVRKTDPFPIFLSKKWTLLTYLCVDRAVFLTNFLMGEMCYSDETNKMFRGCDY